LRHGRTLRRLALDAALAVAALLLLNLAFTFLGLALGIRLHPRLSADGRRFFDSLSIGQLLVAAALVGPVFEEVLFRWLPATRVVALRARARWWWPTGCAIAATFALAGSRAPA
jgi:hypothetical protein